MHSVHIEGTALLLSIVVVLIRDCPTRLSCSHCRHRGGRYSKGNSAQWGSKGEFVDGDFAFTLVILFVLGSSTRCSFNRFCLPLSFGYSERKVCGGEASFLLRIVSFSLHFFSGCLEFTLSSPAENRVVSVFAVLP